MGSLVQSVSKPPEGDASTTLPALYSVHSGHSPDPGSACSTSQGQQVPTAPRSAKPPGRQCPSALPCPLGHPEASWAGSPSASPNGSFHPFPIRSTPWVLRRWWDEREGRGRGSCLTQACHAGSTRVEILSEDVRLKAVRLWGRVGASMFLSWRVVGVAQKTHRRGRKQLLSHSCPPVPSITDPIIT